MRNEKHTNEERQNIPFYSSFMLPQPNTIRLVYNEAFHKKLFFSASAGVQLGVEEGELEESHA